MMTDSGMGAGSFLMAERKAQQGKAPIYLYKITWESPVRDGILRSPHAVELPFVFDNVDISETLVGPNGPGQKKMTELMSSTFAAFARTGNPDVPGVPHWPPYDTVKRPTFIYDVSPKVVYDPDSDIRTFWANYKRPAGEQRKNPLDEVLGGSKFK
jgi:para-nitrobenzyl esterase